MLQTKIFSIFRLKMDICNLKTGICSLQMHIAKLQTEFLPKIARLSEELWTPFLERETFSEIFLPKETMRL